MEKYQANPNNFDDESITEKSDKEKKQESTEKAVDMAGEAALDYFTGGMGSNIKNAASNVPIVGNAVNKTWNNAVKKVSNVVSNTPVGDLMKKADDAGAIDAAKSVKDVVSAGKADGSNLASGATKRPSQIQGQIKNEGFNFSGGNGLFGNNKSNSSNDIMGSIMSKIPPSLKVKIYIGLIIAGFCLLIFVTAFAEQDIINLELTNNTSNISNASFSGGGSRACTQEEIEERLVYVGDSRIVGLKDALNNENISYIGEVSTGHDWFVNTASAELDTKLLDNPNAVIILALGVNDLHNIDNYIASYKEIISKYTGNKFYIMAVNPVDEDLASSNGYTVTNNDIESFNSKLKENFQDNYIDTYSAIDSIDGSDGLHYGNDSYNKVHNKVISSLSNEIKCSSGGDLTFSESYTSGNAKIIPGQVNSSEPDPSGAINYWSNYLNPSDFIYPKDPSTGLSLGAWPKNYQSIPTQLSSYKEYNGFIWPVTPQNDTYTWVYSHNGIDIMASVGTPIYSPVDGTMIYSEWGHTVNKGSDETAYTVSISPDTIVTYGGVSITTVFLTHMSGLRYRCSSCNQKVVKGELLGFVGNAAGGASAVGWAPHLHMTLYGGSYSNGLFTEKIQNFYSITPNTVRRAGE